MRTLQDVHNELVQALKFVRDLAAEELPHAKIGTGGEVALRHILRRSQEALDRAGVR